MLTQNPNSSQSADWASRASLVEGVIVSDPSKQSAILIGLFFVSVPVLFQAPLVRFFPLLSLGGTLLWIASGFMMRRKSAWSWQGDLLLGFSMSWLAGSIYWGWFRAEPLWHLPIEAIGLPLAAWALYKRSFLTGACFYLGSLLGTVITDFYFYALDLVAYWRQVMVVEVQDAAPILQEALVKVQTWQGLFWALAFISVLIAAGVASLRSPSFHWWVFSGAVLGTLLVDALFGLSAFL